MLGYQREFLDFAIEINVLRFGDFTLKSGRRSPYFFNSGLFNTGRALARLGDYYAHAIEHAAIDYDMLFGPAYKGIPLVASAAISLANHYRRDIPYAFNRKEVKDHGEGGNTVGAPLKGRVLIIDDVISAGTSVGESVQIIRAAGAKPAGVVIALDRQERGKGDSSAIQEVEQRYGMPVTSIVKLEHLIEYLGEQPDRAPQLADIRAYQQRYGINRPD